MGVSGVFKKMTEKELREIAAGIRLLILDVDGVLTDGGIILDDDGREIKKFHVRDGHGIKLIQRAGVEVAIITGRSSMVVEHRARELGIKEVYQRCRNKSEVYDRLKEKLGVEDSETAFVGDDIVDISILKRVGLAVVVSDAVEEAKEHAVLVTVNPGGRGAVREVTDLLLKGKGLWDEIIDKYSET
jgi:3-deoxy-D-manno-octulosonate 8-phosphate phosphatase (KDO 8-P phosphatase)